MREDQPDDGLHAEVERTRPPATPRAAAPAPDAGPTSPLEARLTGGTRAARAALLAGILALGLVIVLLVELPGARRLVWLTSPPPPTATLAPAEDQFYMLPNPPGVSVTLDGKPLSRLPLPGTPSLRLARGRHVLAWLPGPFPFGPLRCQLTVPRQASDTCPIDPGFILPASLLPPGGPTSLPSVIDLRESLASLAPDQATRLTTAMRTAMEGAVSGATVLPGERYYSYGPGVPGHAQVTTRALRATLTPEVLAPGALGGCTLSPGASLPCRAPVQDCSEICTLSGLDTGGNWLAGVLVATSWDYQAADGHLVARQLADPGLNSHLVVLLIAWDGSSWRVSPQLGYHPELPAADDVTCDGARDWMAGGPISFVFHPRGSGSAPHGSARFASDAVLAGGCVVGVEGDASHASTGTTALFFEQFGVLTAANGAAHALWPALPRADAAQSGAAMRLAQRTNISP